MTTEKTEINIGEPLTHYPYDEVREIWPCNAFMVEVDLLDNLDNCLTTLQVIEQDDLFHLHGLTLLFKRYFKLPMLQRNEDFQPIDVLADLRQEDVMSITKLWQMIVRDALPQAYRVVFYDENRTPKQVQLTIGNNVFTELRGVI